MSSRKAQKDDRPRILVVDDDKNIRILLCKYLTDAGYRTNMARDALGAVRLLERMDFHVVLTDILLPDVNGTDLLFSIRTRFPFTRVILMTGEPNIESVRRALRGGAFDYLTKPLRKNDIFRSIQKAIMMKELDDENRRLADENHQYQEQLEELVKKRTHELARLSGRIIEIQEEERTRLARELHDDLGQSLLALKLNLQSVFGKLDGISPELKKEFDWSLNYLNGIIDKSRKISHNLSPAALENLGLPLAIREMAESMSRDGVLEIRTELDDLAHYFPGNWDINVYRLVQESLTNAIKHSKATQVIIGAHRTGEGLTLFVKDNGCGFTSNGEEKNTTGSGLGLQIMKKRVELLNGSFIINSTEQTGTEVRFELP